MEPYALWRLCCAVLGVMMREIKEWQNYTFWAFKNIWRQVLLLLSNEFRTLYKLSLMIRLLVHILLQTDVCSLRWQTIKQFCHIRLLSLLDVPQLSYKPSSHDSCVKRKPASESKWRRNFNFPHAQSLQRVTLDVDLPHTYIVSEVPPHSLPPDTVHPPPYGILSPLRFSREAKGLSVFLFADKKIMLVCMCWGEGAVWNFLSKANVSF